MTTTVIVLIGIIAISNIVNAISYFIWIFIQRKEQEFCRKLSKDTFDINKNWIDEQRVLTEERKLLEKAQHEAMMQSIKDGKVQFQNVNL